LKNSSIKETGEAEFGGQTTQRAQLETVMFKKKKKYDFVGGLVSV
jgi:hypothetical protein